MTTDMKKHTLLTIALLLGTLAAKAQTEPDSIVLLDSLSEEIPTGSRYTLSFKGLQLADEQSEAIIKVRIGSNATGADLHILADQILIQNGNDTLVLADQLPDGLATHDFVIYRQARIYVCRDGVTLGYLTTKNYKDEARVVLVNPSALASYTFEVTDQSSVVAPTQEEYETNLANMLTSLLPDMTDENLSPDPYLNSGLDRSGTNAEERGFYTAASANGGYGSAIYVDTDNAYSGPMCLRLEGQADEEAGTGASLTQDIAFTANYPYVVRAMVKSDGWTGNVFIDGENNFLPISDTDGEWQQVEAILTPSSTHSDGSNAFTVSNEDYDSEGTLLIDNIEVYKGLTGTSISTNTAVPAAKVGASVNWSPSHSVTVWRLGMTESDTETFAQIDTSLVTVAGAPFFTRSFTGSEAYAIYLPYGLTNVTATGTWDYRSHTDYHLYHGLDFICQQMDPTTGAFSYLDDDASIDGGVYVIQFADNYEDIAITFDLNPAKPYSPDTEAAFQGLGNGELFAHGVETDDASATLLFFDEDNHLFNTTGSTNSNASALRPFLPYILNTAGQTSIIVDGSTGIQRLTAAQQGECVLVRPTTGGIVLTARANTSCPVHAVSGQRVAQAALTNGDTFVALPAGLYVVAGKKVLVK